MKFLKHLKDLSDDNNYLQINYMSGDTNVYFELYNLPNDEKYNDVIFLNSFSVLKSERGNGLGRLSFDFILNECKRLNYNKIGLSVLNNSFQEEWYKRLGFEFCEVDNEYDEYSWYIKTINKE